MPYNTHFIFNAVWTMYCLNGLNLLYVYVWIEWISKSNNIAFNTFLTYWGNSLKKTNNKFLYYREYDSEELFNNLKGCRKH